MQRDFVAATDVRLVTVDARERFERARKRQEPEAKRKIIGREFIRVFEDAARQVVAEAGPGGSVDFLVQGTLYFDVVESGGGSGTANIKSHHNGGLPDDRNSPWWNRCGHSSRMKFARSASTSGCRKRLSGDTRSRVRVWRSASSGRSARSGWRFFER